MIFRAEKKLAGASFEDELKLIGGHYRCESEKIITVALGATVRVPAGTMVTAVGAGESGWVTLTFSKDVIVVNPGKKATGFSASQHLSYCTIPLAVAKSALSRFKRLP